VNLDYHVEIAKHYYSVPYNLVHQEVEAWITLKTVEIFFRGKRVASHLRSTLRHRPTTIPEHMPSSHRCYRDWSHERIRSEAAKVGPDADTLIDVILRSRPLPEQGFRSAIGILGLVNRYGQERVDAACARALLLNARSYKSVAAILKNGTDKTSPPTPEAPILFPLTSAAATTTIDQESIMLIHPTVERLRALGLAAMADTLVELQNNPEAADMPHADWLGLLIDRGLARRLSNAKLRQAATIENVDYRTARGLDRSLFQTLATGQWIRDCNHLAIVGPTSTGKSWLACALGNKACRDGFSVLYKRASRLFADLAQARGEGRLSRLIAALERVNLLILDDWGPEPLSAEQRRDLLEIVDDRYDKGSLLITSQVPVAQWHDIIADPTLGDAILDRIIHNAHRIELKGDSLRRRTGEKKKRDHLANDRPAGPQAPPMDRRDDLQTRSPALTKKPFPAQIHAPRRHNHQCF
jgi:DNA replication protein DnaC